MMTTIELFPLQNKTEMNSTAVIADEFHNSVGYKISLREMLTGTDEYYQISSGLMISDNRSIERVSKNNERPGSWDQCDANQKRLILHNTQPTELLYLFIVLHHKNFRTFYGGPTQTFRKSISDDIVVNPLSGNPV